MITRTAIFEGNIKKGFEDTFYAHVENELLPLWKQFPHASNVRYFKVTESDNEEREIVLIQQIDYPSKAHLEEALNSESRTKARSKTLELNAIFDGWFYHLISS